MTRRDRIEGLLEQAQMISVTPGMARAMANGNAAKQCPCCGLSCPKYPGRYPKHCPSCGHEWDSRIEVTEADLAEAAPSEPKARAFTRIDDAAKRGGIMRALVDTRKRLNAIGEPSKLMGLLQALAEIQQEISGLQRAAEMKLQDMKAAS